MRKDDVSRIFHKIMFIGKNDLEKYEQLLSLGYYMESISKVKKTGGQVLQMNAV